MTLVRTYTKTEVKAAIDCAEGARFSSFVTVWGGLDRVKGSAGVTKAVVAFC